jgi:hypothetical protein
MVQGGGDAENNIQIVSNYNMLDTLQYDSFIKRFSSTGRFDNATKRLKDLFEKKNSEKVLHYRKAGSYVESSNLRNTQNLIQIRYIPYNTKTLIILPPTNEAKEFINQIMFLVNNNYLIINTKGEFNLERNIFVISLAPFNSSDSILEYFYYKIKLSNLYSYYRVEDPFVFILRKEINNKNGVLIAKSGFQFLQIQNIDDLAPIDYDLINEENITSLKYKGDPNKTYDNFYMIANGEDPKSPIVTDYTFTLKTKIAVLDLIDEDIQTVTVDIQGEKYRIRLPSTPNKNLDKVYSAWVKGSYEKTEKTLIDNLDLVNSIGSSEIPDFLFSLSYFKCFDDASILTKSECNYMKEQLQKIYLYSLKKHEKNTDKLSTGVVDNRIFISHNCSSLDLSTDTSKVICKVKYKEGLKENEETNIEIDKKYIPILKSTNEKDIESIRLAVLTEFRKQK